MSSRVRGCMRRAISFCTSAHPATQCQPAAPQVAVSKQSIARYPPPTTPLFRVAGGQDLPEFA